MITRKRVLQALEALGADERVWVAGSAAIIPEKADDIDVWVLKKSGLKPEAFDGALWEPILTPEGYPEKSIAGVTKRIQTVVPAVEGWTEAIKLQVMFTSWGNIFDLLETFDVSCHAWARRQDGFLVAHPKATLPGSPIVRLQGSLTGLCNCDDCKALAKTDLTETRIQEFTTRYANTKGGDCWLPN